MMNFSWTKLKRHKHDIMTLLLAIT